MKYTLAGAYDSNIALLLTVGHERHASYEAMAEVLRQMTIDGQDVQTNLRFHYGLVHWFLSQDVHAKSTTAFIAPYLTLAGLLKQEVSRIDLDHALDTLANQSSQQNIYARKRTLITRPLKRVMSDPHLLIGWIAKTRRLWTLEDQHLQWLTNPFEVLADLYHYLNMNAVEGAAAAEVIWDHDQLILEQGLEFYEDLELLAGTRSWVEWTQVLSQSTPLAGIDPEDWPAIQGAHHGFQMGLELLGLIVKASLQVGFDELRVQDDLSVSIPEHLKESEQIAHARKILVPPPKASANEIVAVSGGMFYSQETPGAAPFLDVGTHFEVGDPLYIIEVMKMFNKVYAEFSGTVVECCVEHGDGMIVKKGQTLYRIEPDERSEDLDVDAINAHHRAYTEAQLSAL